MVAGENSFYNFKCCCKAKASENDKFFTFKLQYFFCDFIENKLLVQKNIGKAEVVSSVEHHAVVWWKRRAKRQHLLNLLCFSNKGNDDNFNSWPLWDWISRPTRVATATVSCSTSQTLSWNPENVLDPYKWHLGNCTIFFGSHNIESWCRHTGTSPAYKTKNQSGAINITMQVGTTQK